MILTLDELLALGDREVYVLEWNFMVEVALENKDKDPLESVRFKASKVYNFVFPRAVRTEEEWYAAMRSDFEEEIEEIKGLMRLLK